MSLKHISFSVLLILTVSACDASTSEQNHQSESEGNQSQHSNQTKQIAKEKTIAPHFSENAPEDEARTVSVKAISSEEISSLTAIASISGIECDDPARGKGCKATDGGDQFYDVALFPPCKSADRFSYAGVSVDANLVDKIAPEYESSIVIAELKAGQIVCVRASASYALQGEKYYFVIAVPAESASACAGEAPCVAYGNKQVVWRAQAEEKKCASTGMDRFEGVCAMGWMNSEYLDINNKKAPAAIDFEGGA